MRKSDALRTFGPESGNSRPSFFCVVPKGGAGSESGLEDGAPGGVGLRAGFAKACKGEVAWVWVWVWALVGCKEDAATLDEASFGDSDACSVW